LIAYLPVLIGAYLLGSIPFGLIVARLAAGVDVRRAGSGNIGATNVLRAAGKGWAVLTLLADVLKGVLPVLAAAAWWPGQSGPACGAGLAAFLGHCFPVWLGFKGGKGVATALGVFLALSPAAAGLAALVFLGAVAATRTVSVGSMSSALSLIPILAWLDRPGAVIGLAAVVAGVVVLRHKDNLVRLKRGEEKKLGRKRS